MKGLPNMYFKQRKKSHLVIYLGNFDVAFPNNMLEAAEK